MMKRLRVACASIFVACCLGAIAAPLPHFQVYKLGMIADNGGQFCEDNFAGETTCIPAFDNTQNVTLKLSAQGYGSIDVQPGFGAALAGTALPVIDSLVFVVDNETTGSEIFNATAYNQVGIICTAGKCAAWGEPPEKK